MLYEVITQADLVVLDGSYSEKNDQDVEKLHNYLVKKSDLPVFTGTLNVMDGVIENQPTILHARSVAEDIKVYVNSQPYSGKLEITNGNLAEGQDVTLKGKSLMHSAPLTTVAFTRSWFGDFGKYIVSIGLLMFAFSTAISWSYYGDRAITYLFGSGKVIYYHIIYVIV